MKTQVTTNFDVLVIGGGAGGISVIASLLKRQPDLKIALAEPSSEHYYQPGWTLVGRGVFKHQQTVKLMENLIPKKVNWYQSAAAHFSPMHNQVTLVDGTCLSYRSLIVAIGLQLNWSAIEGLDKNLGSHGITSNYLQGLAPYTWELVKQLKHGHAIFTQPPMPIKCAGAPQKAMYLSCDHWQQKQVLNKINVEFCTAGAALFGVPDYVPALQRYVKRYNINLNMQTNLMAIDASSKTAYFKQTNVDGSFTNIEKRFDLLHICPPQIAPEVIRMSSLADQAGWVDIHPDTLQHKTWANVFALGDCANTPNAKTAAAVRKQAPVVAENILSMLNNGQLRAVYDGYGSCPLTVERGKIVLAEFLYGGKVNPTFPKWLIDGTKPSRLSWLLKEKLLPPLYWYAMLKGYEWMASPLYQDDIPRDRHVNPSCNFNKN